MKVMDEEDIKETIKIIDEIIDNVPVGYEDSIKYIRNRLINNPEIACAGCRRIVDLLKYRVDNGEFPWETNINRSLKDCDKVL